MATAIGTHSRVAGTWERIGEAQTRVAGVWTPLQKIYVKNGGVWKEVYVSPAEEINITTQTILDEDFLGPPFSGFSAYRLMASGNAEEETNDSGTSLITGQWRAWDYDREFECKWDEVDTTGTATRTPPFAEATWNDLGASNHEWYFSASGTGYKEWEFNVTIREKVTGDGETTALIRLAFVGEL